MGKISYDDKLRMQTLREQGGKAIIAKYPHKGWKLVTVNAICKRIDQTGFAVQRKPGSGRPATVRTADTVWCQQESALVEKVDFISLRKRLKSHSGLGVSPFATIGFSLSAWFMTVFLAH